MITVADDPTDEHVKQLLEHLVLMNDWQFGVGLVLRWDRCFTEIDNLADIYLPMGLGA